MGSLNIRQVFHERFLIQDFLGEGGMGQVYLAKQLDADRLVALKIMRFSLSDIENERSRFLREGKVLAELNHPHIVSFYYYAIDPEDRAYFVSEYLKGETLAKKLSSSPGLSLERTLKIMKQVCLALEHAHSKGIVHRDLKPGNIMLIEKPEADHVKLLDFGLAGFLPQWQAEMEKLTVSGRALGTVNYMSPEQCLGKPANIESEVYAWGCVFFECLSGKQLLEGANALEVVYRQEKQSVSTLLNVLPAEFPEMLLDILHKCLAKSPEDRFHSMSELRACLELFEEQLKTGDASNAAYQKLSKKNLIACFFTAAVLMAALIYSSQFFSSQEKSGSKNTADPRYSKKTESKTRLVRKDAAMLASEAAKLRALGKNQEALKLLSNWYEKYKNNERVGAKDKTLILQNILLELSALYSGADYEKYCKEGRKCCLLLGNSQSESEVKAKYLLAEITSGMSLGKNPAEMRDQALAAFNFLKTTHLSLPLLLPCRELASILVSFGLNTEAYDLLEYVLKNGQSYFGFDDQQYAQILWTLGDACAGLEDSQKRAFQYYSQAKDDLISTGEPGSKRSSLHNADSDLACIAERLQFFSARQARAALSKALSLLKGRSGKSTEDCNAAYRIFLAATNTSNLEIALEAAKIGSAWLDNLPASSASENRYCDLKWGLAELSLRKSGKKRSDFDNSLALIKNAIEFSKTHGDALKPECRIARLADSLFTNNQADIGIRILGFAKLNIEAESADPLTNAEYANLLRSMKNYTQAEKCRQRSIKAALEVHNSDAIELALIALVRSRDIKEAEALLEKFLALKPESEKIILSDRARLYMCVGMELASCNRLQDAQVYLEKAIATYSKLGCLKHAENIAPITRSKLILMSLKH